MADTVFNREMRVVFNDDPAIVKRRLKAKYPESWVKVCIGETGQVVSITEYLYEETYTEIVGMIEDILRKHDLAMYRRHPERLKIYIEKAARKIIETARKD